MTDYDLFQRMCMMRNIPESDLCRYLDQLLGSQGEKRQELAKQFAEEVRNRCPVRRKKIHLLQPDDLGSYPGDAKLAEAMKNGCLADAENEAPEDEDDGYSCSREEMDRYIEYLIEIADYKRASTDLVDAYTLLEAEAEGEHDQMPCGIGIVPFVEAWNEYIEKKPIREKIMFTWDQFLDLPKDIQRTVVFLWEMEYADHKPSLTTFCYGDEGEYDDVRMFDIAEMYNWLKKYRSPNARELETGDSMLEEYHRTGHVGKCPICEGNQVLIYGHAFKLNGSLTLICPKCGVIGHYFGPKDIHDNADKETIRGNAQIHDAPYIPSWKKDKEESSE